MGNKFAVSAVLLGIFLASAKGQTFAATGSMTIARAWHTATLLQNGKVLIAGGILSNSSALASTEVYDPITGTFAPTGNMTTTRRLPTATLLPDGKVLIAGGDTGAPNYLQLASAELFDPETGTFSRTGDMNQARLGHSANLLTAGKVLISGGVAGTWPNVADAELYDPKTGAFTVAGDYVTGGTACDYCPPDVLLADGRVLFTSGQPPQIFDPNNGTFGITGRMVSPFHTAATLLTNGNVLLTGGESDVTGRFAGAELYNPDTGMFRSTSDMTSRRVWHSSNLLPDGSVLIAGGDTDNCSGSSGCYFAGNVASAELYDPRTGLFTPTAIMTTPRSLHRATVLRDGRVLITGGLYRSGVSSFNETLASAELYTPAGQNFAPLHFIPVSPCRVADTRNAEGPFGGPYLGGGAAREFVIANSSCGIPASALAYSLNLTVVPMTSLEYVTLWPTGEPQPLVSTLNSIDARVKANATIVAAGADTGVSVFATNDTHVILDINGYFVPASNTPALAFFPLTPCRVADTRLPLGSLGQPYLSGGKARDFSITSSDCNVPTSAQAYSLNFTALPKGPSLEYLATWPAGQSQPLVSTLNDPSGTIVANAAIVPAGANGDISVFATHDTEVTIDINGYFAPPQTGGLSLYTLAPCRVMDTRDNTGQSFSGTYNIPILNGSACPVPPQAQAYVLNATVVPSARLDFLTLWPNGLTQPNVSTLNAVDGAITSNTAIVLTSNGLVNAFTTNPTHLIFDLFAYFAP